MHISENAEQDVYIRKLIAGLVEKSVNNAEKAYVFDNLSEARHYENKVWREYQFY